MVVERSCRRPHNLPMADVSSVADGGPLGDSNGVLSLPIGSTPRLGLGALPVTVTAPRTCPTCRSRLKPRPPRATEHDEHHHCLGFAQRNNPSFLVGAARHHDHREAGATAVTVDIRRTRLDRCRKGRATFVSVGEKTDSPATSEEAYVGSPRGLSIKCRANAVRNRARSARVAPRRPR